MDSFDVSRGVYDAKLNIKHEHEETIIDVAEFFEEDPKILNPIKYEKHEQIQQTEATDIFCDICYKHFKSVHYLETHKLMIHDGAASTKHVRRMEKCKLCHKSVLNLKVHESIFHAKPSYQCLLCSFVTKYPGNLEAHTRSIHKRVALFPCYQCDKKFKDQSNRNRHVRQVHKKNDVKYECHICPKQVCFRRSDNLNLHFKRIHGLAGGVKPIQSLITCDVCAATFITKQSIIRHFNVMHKPKKPKPFKCKICTISFPSKDSLRNHLDSAHLHKFLCRHCKKSFGRAKTLKTHELKGKCRS